MQENKFKTLYKFHCIIINKDWEILIIKDKIGDSKKRKFRSINYKPTIEKYTKQDIVKQIKYELDIDIKEEDLICIYKYSSGVENQCNVVNEEVYYIKLNNDCSNIKFNKAEIDNVYFLTMKELSQLSINAKGGYNYTLPKLINYKRIPEAPKVDLSKIKEEPLTQKVIDLLASYYDDTHEEEQINNQIIELEEEQERQYQLDNEFDEEYEDEFEGQRLLDEAEEIYEEEATNPFFDDDYNDTIWD